MRPRIALVHAVVVAMQPVEDAFQRLWPEVERVNILDDSLPRDRELSPGISPAIMHRIAELAGYGVATGAAGILFTCSAFGAAIEAAARTQSCPVLKPNEAMFEAAIALGNDIGMLATFEPSVAGMEQEFRVLAAERRSKARIRTLCIPAAMAALKAGDAATHNRLLAEAAPEFGGCDAILLAHFSTSRAEAAVAATVAVPVLTAPGAAVLKLKAMLAN